MVYAAPGTLHFPLSFVLLLSPACGAPGTPPLVSTLEYLQRICMRVTRGRTGDRRLDAHLGTPCACLVKGGQPILLLRLRIALCVARPADRGKGTRAGLGFERVRG